MNVIPKLEKTDTTIFLATKGAEHINYKEEKFIFEEGKPEVVLNNYPILVYSFIELTGLNKEYILLEELNKKLLDILELLAPKRIKNVLLDIQTYRYIAVTGYGTEPMKASYSPAQAIFLSVYGELQSIQIYSLKGDERVELIHMDKEFIKKGKVK